MTNIAVELIRRRFVYWQHPIRVYEIAGCSHCGSSICTYSEFVGRMYCYDCASDYIPAHWGIFDSPIPLNLTHELGIWFHRVELLTGRLIKEDDPEWKEAWP